MKIELEQQGAVTVLRLEGRLDATWAQHVATQAQEALRDGRHHLLLDAAGISYLSSAGIRVLIQLRRDVAAVQGSFRIVSPSEFVEKTLRLAGLDELLTAGDITAFATQAAAAPGVESDGMVIEVYQQDKNGRGMALQIAAPWRPWEQLDKNNIVKLPLPGGTVAVGIGAPDEGTASTGNRMGEFMAVCGCMIQQPADGELHPPDFIVQRGELIPEIHAVQAIAATGSFSTLLRFRPAKAGARMEFARMAATALETLNTDTAVLALLAECDGLVGATMARSPGTTAIAEQPDSFPEIRNWIHFCGERVHAGKSVLAVAFVARAEKAGRLQPYMGAMPSIPGILIHAHAAPFTFRPLPDGPVKAEDQIPALLEARDPLDLLHLLEDDRPLIGLGGSRFIRGACWCAPLYEDREAAK